MITVPLYMRLHSPMMGNLLWLGLNVSHAHTNTPEKLLLVFKNLPTEMVPEPRSYNARQAHSKSGL